MPLSLKSLALFGAVAMLCIAVAGQSPNTASIVVVVVDPSGAVVRDAKVSIANAATGTTRETTSGADGSATIAALPLSGAYALSVTKAGFSPEQRQGITLRAGETATLKITLRVGSEKSEVTVYGTAEGVRTDPQIGGRLDAQQLDETPILGRKISSVPLLNASYRPAKGTGDLFVNSTYFVTGVGGRRQTTTTLDGANNDEAWGRQVPIATVPVGAVQEVIVLSNAFSSEFGWTAGPALNIVTKAGTNAYHGDALYMARPGDWQPTTFSKANFCAPSVPSCTTPSTLQSISPQPISDSLQQISGSFGGPLIKDKTFFFATADYTLQDRSAPLSSTLPAFLLPPDGSLVYDGHYRQTLVNGRFDHQFTARQSLMLRLNVDRFDDDNPGGAVGGTVAPATARYYARRSVTGQANFTSVISPKLVNEARFSYLHGDPVTFWAAKNLSTTYTRSGSVPFTIGQSRISNLWSHQAQFADTLSWSRNKHYLRFGTSIIRHTSGGFGNEPGTAVLGTFTFRSTTTAPFDQLTIADVQNYLQPINFGISTYELGQWLLSGFMQDDWKLRPDLTLNLGLRYDRQTLTDATKDFAPRVGFGWNPGGSSRWSIRGGYGMYYTQIRSNVVASYLTNGLDGLTSYTAAPGQAGFPTCLTCVPVNLDPHTLSASQLPARDIIVRAGHRSFYEAQFARFGLNFDLLPNYPSALVNPRSQVGTVGVEHEVARGVFFSGDYVYQHVSGIDRTVDINAPAPFDRTAPGQVRTVIAANATRPILPVNGGVRQVNVLTNLGLADYDGLQTQFNIRRYRRMFASVSYTLSKATNTTEPDGNGIAPNDSNIARLGEQERGPSFLDQRHRAVLFFSYDLPWNFRVGTLTQFASGRPFSATTGVDNNGDGVNNDRPVINGVVAGKSSFRSTMTQDVGMFVENRIRLNERASLLLRLEAFNLLNHANILGRGQTVYGDSTTPNPTFGQIAAVGTASTAVPVLANIDPPRMFQLQARFVF